MALLTVAAISMVLVAMGCTGQQDTKTLNDAIALAEQGNKTLQELNWEAYAALVHPDDLDSFRAMLLPDIEKLAVMRNADSITLFDRTFSLEDLRSGTSKEFFVDLMKTVFQVSVELGQSFSGMHNDHIGAVAENDSLIHVVVNTSMSVGLRNVTETNVATIRRFEDGWKLRMSPKLEGIAMMLQQSMQMQQR